MLNLSELFFYFGDVIPVGVEKLGLMLFDHVFYLSIHIVDHFIQLFISLQN